MSHAQIGTLIQGPAERDAIHVAVAPVTAATKLKPGGFIRIYDGSAFDCEPDVAHGIVDPFLSKPVRGGEQFWVFMAPGSVTDLKHSWSHPAIPDEIVKIVEDEDEEYDGCRGCY